MTNDNNNSMAYEYNGLGERISKKMNNLDKTDYVYNNKKLLGEYSTGNYVDYIYAGDLLVAINKNGTVYYVHNDHLNTPSINKIREFETCLKLSYFVIHQVTNSNNAVVFDWPAVDPFGANFPITNTIDFNIRYPGQYYDSETAYHYNYHRYYNPQTGKYLQADPIGLTGGYNLYNYVDNNSLSGIDPEGLLKLFFGSVTSQADKVLYAAYQNDADDPNRIIIYGHGSMLGMVLSPDAPIKIPKFIDVSKGATNIKAQTLISILQYNGINFKDYKSIELKPCDLALTSFPQKVANATGLKVGATDDYYYYENNRSVGPIKSLHKDKSLEYKLDHLIEVYLVV